MTQCEMGSGGLGASLQAVTKAICEGARAEPDRRTEDDGVCARDLSGAPFGARAEGRHAEGLAYAQRAVDIFSRLRTPKDIAEAQAALRECTEPPVIAR